jgi:uncharacterized protein YjiS (DUF1127 family)
MCGTRGTELYTTSYLRRCVCTAFACRPRARVSNVMIATRYSIDTYIFTHEHWQRKCRMVAALLRMDPHYVRPQQLEHPDVTVWPRSKRNRIFWMSGHHLTCYAGRELCYFLGVLGFLPACNKKTKELRRKDHTWKKAHQATISCWTHIKP